MSFSRMYLVYSIVLVSIFSWALYTGYSFASVDEVHVPKTVRSNPGSYRSHYSSSSRSRGRSSSSFIFFGGK